MSTIDLSTISASELEALLKKKQDQDAKLKKERKAAYEGIRASVVLNIEQKVRNVTSDVMGLFAYVWEETKAFRDVMAEYGMLRSNEQLSYTLQEENFKVEVKTNKVKKFDERADIAASRLVEFLRAWIEAKDKGTNDPMYQLAMTMIERNKEGDLDYKSISKLYELEEQFADTDYSAIMQLFKESNVTEGTATNFYFWQKTELGVWKKLEPSFNRL
jgi:hypothetical protein